MSQRTLSALVAAAVTAGVVALTAPAAHAAPAEDSVSVSLAGLDAADPSDAARIALRIRGAAREYCGSNLIQPARLRASAAACERSVVANAQADTLALAAKTGGPFRLTLRSN
ncbi:MAG: UrcA family protein [Allosphingosinicella sp.]